RVLEELAEPDVHHARVDRTSPHAAIEPAGSRPGAGDGRGQHEIGGRGEHVASPAPAGACAATRYTKAWRRIVAEFAEAQLEGAGWRAYHRGRFSEVAVGTPSPACVPVLRKRFTT